MPFGNETGPKLQAATFLDCATVNLSVATTSPTKVATRKSCKGTTQYHIPSLQRQTGGLRNVAQVVFLQGACSTVQLTAGNLRTMVSAKTGAIVLCCFTVLAFACSSVAAADAAPTPPEAPAGLKLAHPLGSGKNKPISLNLRPKHGRRFVNLMKQFVEAARAGKMDVMELLQQQLFALTRPKHHKRHLLQATGPAEVRDCVQHACHNGVMPAALMIVKHGTICSPFWYCKSLAWVICKGSP